MAMAWGLFRKLVEWFCITAVGKGAWMFLAAHGIHPDQWAASIIGHAADVPGWAVWVVLGALGIVGVFLIERYFWPWLEARNKLPLGFYDDHHSGQDPNLISLQQAARSAYTVLHHVVNSIIKESDVWTDPQKALGTYAWLILRDPGIPTWGIDPISKEFTRMPDDASTFGISGDASEMYPIFQPERRWTDVQIAEADFSQRLAELKEEYGV